MPAYSPKPKWGWDWWSQFALAKGGGVSDPFASQKATIKSYIQSNGSLVPSNGTAATITQGSDFGSPTLTGSSVGFTDAKLNYLNGHTEEDIGVPSPGSFPLNLFQTAKNLSFSSSERDGNITALEFNYTGQSVEIGLRFDGNCDFRLLADNLVVGTKSFSVTGNDAWVLIDFGSSATRNIRFEFAGKAACKGLKLQSGGTLNSPTDPTRKRITWLGDSWIEGQTNISSTARHACLAAYGSKLLGFADYLCSGFGGTGYKLTNNPGFGSVRPALTTRAGWDSAGADVIVFGCGINDSSDYATLETQINNAFDLARAAAPNALIYALGCWGNGSGNDIDANTTAITAKIQAACAGRAGFKFLAIKQITFTKTGSHPDAAGAILLGTGIANLIKADLGL